MCEEKGVKPTSWSRDKLLKLIGGDIVMKATDPTETQKPKDPNDEKLNRQTVDSQLSGYYYVSGAKYHYDAMHHAGLYTELFLSRREWTPSKKTS